MPPQQNKAPDFIPAPPDFIPEGQNNSASSQITSPAAPQEKPGFGKGFVEGLTGVFRHPIQSAEGMIQPVLDAMPKYEMTNFGPIPVPNPDALRHNTEQGAAVMANPKYAAGNVTGNLALAALTGGLLKGADIGIDAIPTRAKAGQLFEQAMAKAGDQPVTLTRSMGPLERAQQLSARGHGIVAAADNLYKRINTVNPLDYREARDWGSSLSRLTGEDSMKASPTLKAKIKDLSHAFNADVGDTAEKAGVGPQYQKGMKMYRQASRNADIAKAGGKAALKVGVPAALGYGGYRATRALLPDLWSNR